MNESPTIQISYKSIADLNQTILLHLNKFPHDVDLIVGLPRSGMLPANLIALYLNKPYTDIDSFIEGRIYSSGDRTKYIDNTNIHNILVVDDSILNGTALQKAKEKIDFLSEKFRIEYAVIYATTQGSQKVDYFCEIIDGFRFFQWNILQHPFFLANACVDIDGVLCVDPPEDDDGPKYINYISNAIPLYTPTYEINTLVTCRLEKYRKITEEWLANHHIKYKHLVMLDFPTKTERLAWGKHGEYKGNVFKESSNLLFIESSLSQAEKFAATNDKIMIAMLLIYFFIIILLIVNEILIINCQLSIVNY